MPPGSRPVPRRSSLVRADGRTKAAKRLKALEASLAAEIGQPLTQALRLRVGAAAGLAVRWELAVAALVRGDSGISDEDLVRLHNTLHRALSDLGLAEPPRETRTAGPTLNEYLASRKAKA